MELENDSVTEGVDDVLRTSVCDVDGDVVTDCMPVAVLVTVSVIDSVCCSVTDPLRLEDRVIDFDCDVEPVRLFSRLDDFVLLIDEDFVMEATKEIVGTLFERDGDVVREMLRDRRVCDSSEDWDFVGVALSHETETCILMESVDVGDFDTLTVCVMDADELVVSSIVGLTTDFDFEDVAEPDTVDEGVPDLLPLDREGLTDGVSEGLDESEVDCVIEPDEDPDCEWVAEATIGDMLLDDDCIDDMLFVDDATSNDTLTVPVIVVVREVLRDGDTDNDTDTCMVMEGLRDFVMDFC